MGRMKQRQYGIGEYGKDETEAGWNRGIRERWKGRNRIGKGLIKGRMELRQNGNRGRMEQGKDRIREWEMREWRHRRSLE